MPYRKKLIEVALPLEAINKEAAREKSIRHGHPSTLHLWWARRPLAACRAVLFSSLVDDPEEPGAPQAYLDELDKLPGGSDLPPGTAIAEVRREKLFRFIEELVKWENSNNERVIGTARRLILAATEGNPPPVLDPFCGGGSIPLEAQRLGLKAHASDLNPVAVLITKALVEIPPKFAGRPPVHPQSGNPEARIQNAEERRGPPAGRRSSDSWLLNSDSWPGATGLAEDVRYYGKWMRDEAEKRIGHLYPKVKLPKEQGGGEATVIAWLWARTLPCPNPSCRATVPLSRLSALGKERGEQRYLHYVADEQRRVVTKIVSDESPPPIQHANATCPVCGQRHRTSALRDLALADGFGVQLLAVVAQRRGGLCFLPPEAEQEQSALAAAPEWKPDLQLVRASQYMGPTTWGIETVGDLSSARQCVALSAFSDLLLDARDLVMADGGAEERADALATYLACAVGRSVDMWTTSAVWGGSFVAHTFGWPALQFAWDYAEANPFSDATGSWSNAIEWGCRVLAGLPADGVADVQQLDATKANWLPGSVLCTDPPYYNNVPYADLSDVFYAWHRRGIGRLYPSLFSTMGTPKAPELVATPYHFEGDSLRAKRHFEEGLRRFFQTIQACTHPGWPATVYYAFKEEDTDLEGGPVSPGWETALTALTDADFQLVATWPLRTERPGRLRAAKSNALASSVVLVCHPRPTSASMATQREFASALRKELPPALRQLTHAGIAPVDLAQATIGPGMAVFSRYSKVLEADGSAMTVRTALQIINQELDAYLAEQEGDLDADTRFCVAWFEQHGMEEGVFGEADVLARAKNSSVEGIEEAGVLHARGGKVRLRRRSEYPETWDPATDRRLTVWECTQHLVANLERFGEPTAADLVRRLGGGMSEVARALAYRLYSIADRKGWSDEARAYNALVVSWPEITRLAGRAPAEQGRLAVE